MSETTDKQVLANAVYEAAEAFNKAAKAACENGLIVTAKCEPMKEYHNLKGPAIPMITVDVSQKMKHSSIPKTPEEIYRKYYSAITLNQQEKL